ncbi:uncharacterized protein LOC129350782 isoform X3 [Amphiprion ocellaris]|uniref:uncharacterized protein LOC129350782 isoform X2 n=1 Tax=Amphiprion ocellaris TaxID=80972 RepID=UPI002410E9B2|nr:uncharacterized protein LOC129350782 isoform X2 [Amphiprion ocellaris]XP_054874307.1 uncharacterized protein LOC129350782 isoform X3 [Amphiprion ocellaris]
MADFVKNMLGNDGMRDMVASETGKVVEGFVKKAMGGEGGDQKEEGAGDVVGTLMSAVTGGGDKKEEGAGDVVGTLMSAVTGGGDKKEGEGGLDVSKALGGLF